MTSDEFFACYDSELVLWKQSAKSLHQSPRVLKHLRNSIGQFPPTPELGKQFLAQSADRKVTTRSEYTHVISAF
jgi:hypothetical protein